jgi:hypothetical protein
MVMDPVLQIILGFIAILLASLLERYCEFGRLAQPKYKPGILKTSFRYVLEALWMIMLLAAAGLLFFRGWFLSVIGILAFWVILPIVLTPIIRYRLLPHWDEVKSELEPKGLNERNYWREDWWMVEEKKKKVRRKRR